MPNVDVAHFQPLGQMSPAGATPSFSVERGVRQGEILSPGKFNLWLDAWLRHAEQQFPDSWHPDARWQAAQELGISGLEFDCLVCWCGPTSALYAKPS